MNIFKISAFLLAGFVLAACASAPPSPYEKGKSSADVPARIHAIKLKPLVMSNQGNNQPPRDLSTNDQEVLALAKANIVSQFTNFGYKIIEGDRNKGDISVAFVIDYQPDYVLVSRQAKINGMVYDTDGSALFHAEAAAQNNGGGSLLGAVVASAMGSRDEMVSAVARDVTINIVNELQKGTKNASPSPLVK